MKDIILSIISIIFGIMYIIACDRIKNCINGNKVHNRNDYLVIIYIMIFNFVAGFFTCYYSKI